MLRSSQLRAHLAKGAQQAYLVINPEPVLQTEDRDIIRAAMACDERQCMLVDTSFNLPEAKAELATGSLFGGSCLVELLVAEPLGAALAKQLQELAAIARASGHRLLVACSALARAGKWSKELGETFVMVGSDPVPPERMAGWIEARARHVKLAIDAEAAAALASNTENNLSRAAQELEKLALVLGEGATVGLAELDRGIGDENRDDLRSLREALAAGDARRALRAVRNLRAVKESPVLVVWALAEELRALNALQHQRPAWGVFGSHRSNLERLARRLDRRDVAQLVASLASCDLAAKGLRGSSPWLRLERLAGTFANLARHNRLEAGLL